MLKLIIWIITILAVLFLLLRFYIIPNSPMPENIMLSSAAAPISPTSEQTNHTVSSLSLLSPCPDSPNCVSSTAARNSQKIDAISFEGSPEDAITKLRTIALTLPKSEVVNQQNNYLHVIFKSPLMNYVDDTEFLVDETTNLIHVRSAARLGKMDFDKNRERIETIRKEF